jgi:hypothetical protein
MKLHTGNGGITGMAMSHDQGEAWWMEGLLSRGPGRVAGKDQRANHGEG